MKEMVIIWNYSSIGGIESMILRIAKYCYQNSIPLNYCTHNCNDEGYIKSLNLYKVKLKKVNTYWNSNLTKFTKNESMNFLRKGEYVCIVFDYEEYFLCQKYKKINQNITVFLYVVHPFVHTCKYRLLENTKLEILLPIIKKSYKRFLVEMIENNSIIFMDEETIDFNWQEFKLSFSKEIATIIRLPYMVQEYQYKDEMYKSNNILTISRIEFPFKEYIKGLIDDFCELRNEKHNINLIIIGDGPNYKDLKEYVDKKGIKRKNIHLLGKIDYQDLKQYIVKSKVFVGMGTCLLDVANQGLPAICAIAYTEKNYTLGLFYEFPSILGATIQEVKEPKQVKKYIEKILNADEEEFKDISLKTWDSLKNNYNINIFLDTIMKKENKNITIKKYIPYRIFVQIRKVLCFVRRIKKG